MLREYFVGLLYPDYFNAVTVSHCHKIFLAKTSMNSPLSFASKLRCSARDFPSVCYFLEQKRDTAIEGRGPVASCADPTIPTPIHTDLAP